MTRAVIDRATSEAEKGFETWQLRRRPGRPPKGDGPGEVVPVRLDASTRAALKELARLENTTVSEVIRRAVQHCIAAGNKRRS